MLQSKPIARARFLPPSFTQKRLLHANLLAGSACFAGQNFACCRLAWFACLLVCFLAAAWLAGLACLLAGRAVASLLARRQAGLGFLLACLLASQAYLLASRACLLATRLACLLACCCHRSRDLSRKFRGSLAAALLVADVLCANVFVLLLFSRPGYDK